MCKIDGWSDTVLQIFSLFMTLLLLGLIIPGLELKL